MRLVCLVAVLGLAMAGCAEEGASDGDEGIEAKDVQVKDLKTGAISGVVVTETIQPIDAATVTLLGVGQETITNAEGQFVFEDLEPGAYFLEAAAKGHNSTQASVEVVAGGVAKPKMLLPAVAVKDPYHVTVQRNTFNVFSVPVLIVYYTGETIDVDGRFDTLVVDGTWEGDVFVVLDEERAINTVVAGDPGGWGASMDTPTAFSRHLEGGDDVNKDISAFEWSSKPGFDTVSFQAQGQVFFTTWYHEPAPEGWSVLDGDQ